MAKPRQDASDLAVVTSQGIEVFRLSFEQRTSKSTRTFPTPVTGLLSRNLTQVNFNGEAMLLAIGKYTPITVTESKFLSSNLGEGLLVGALRFHRPRLHRRTDSAAVRLSPAEREATAI